MIKIMVLIAIAEVLFDFYCVISFNVFFILNAGISTECFKLLFLFFIMHSISYMFSFYVLDLFPFLFPWYILNTSMLK
jgi:hypothetical protein